jgi:predicted phosphodiesterase
LAIDAAKIVGAQGRLFADPHPPPDATTFLVDNTSKQYYQSPYYKLHKNQVQGIPASRKSPPRMDLAEVLGKDVLDAVTAAKKISFHAVGDTGAAKVNAFQTAAQARRNEATVADAMSADLLHPGPDTPAFFFHLGDVVYYFGEGQYYYDQFYDPFRAYDRPIFAVPGNHDGAVFGASANVPQVPSLDAFLRNFCAAGPGPSPDAGALVRSTMTQPGVYFALDAPYVTVIGLYTNVLEGPGVVSSQGGKYPIGDAQLAFLTAELNRLKPLRKSGERAVVIACHHPPVSVDSKHGGTSGLAADIDTACRSAGLWPDVVLSGHAHLYQRFTRSVDGREIPYIVAGSGGFAATSPVAGLPAAPLTQGEYTLVAVPRVEFGFLTLTVDMAAKRKTLTVSFDSRGLESQDSVTVDLGRGRLVRSRRKPSAKTGAARKTGKRKAAGTGKKTGTRKTAAGRKSAAKRAGTGRSRKARP